ncbi:hypothetical protein LY78DRAFT_685985 [Colletotrichum sublineola]|nr:hypothetical protein LY78DRAFT_685985 [Colletotrichum sublineola]
MEHLYALHAKTDEKIHTQEDETTKHEKDISTLESMITANGAATEDISEPLRDKIRASHDTWLAQARLKAVVLERRLAETRSEAEGLARMMQYRKTMDEHWSKLARREANAFMAKSRMMGLSSGALPMNDGNKKKYGDR